MTFTKLPMHAAALALITAPAVAQVDTGETTNRQFDQPVAENEGTDYDTKRIETEEGLQNAETVNRQAPQAVDPVTIDVAGLSQDAAETYTAVAAARGTDIVLQDGFVLGRIANMDIDNAGKGEITIDVSDTQKIRARQLVVTTGPENLMVKDGRVSLASNADQIALLATDVGTGADGDRARVLLN